MPTIDITVETPLSGSTRAAQVSSMFDVPPQKRSTLTWRGEFPIDERPWNIGLIVGPSGCGKSTILKSVFGEPKPLSWGGASVIDDFSTEHSVEQISGVCQAVGFNTIPAWLRPKHVLSNGEQFRVEMARRLLEDGERIVMDEFTSVVDRQVARIGSHAVQKWVRRTKKQFVAATCHYDLEEWLQPDWVLEPVTMTFKWRAVQRRPQLIGTISHVRYEAWHLFAPYHYLSADMHRAAQCYVLSIDGQPAAFSSVLYRPHPKVQNIYALSRSVTLPDFQGMGLVFALTDTLGAAYRALGRRLRANPAHPAYIRARDKSPVWALVKKPGYLIQSSRAGRRSTISGDLGMRPCAVFEYCGPAMDRDKAAALIGAN